MSDYGLTAQGFAPKPFEVITKELQEELISNLGPLNFDDNTVISNIVNIFAEREALIWQATSSLYDSMSPSAATGISLDNQCGLIGLKRLVASYSYVTAQIVAENFSVLPPLTPARIPNLNTIFLNQNEVIINNESCTGIKLYITTIQKSVYKITINNEIISYTKKVDDTIILIATELSALINNKQNLSLEAKEAENTINIISKEYKTNFSCVLEPSGGIAISTVTNNALYYAEKTGAIPIPSGALTEFIGLVNGIISINNFDAGITGRDDETDYDLRERRKISLSLPGRGTLKSLEAKLLNIKNVSAVLVEENTTDQIQGLLTPHSFLVTVNGGSDQDIAQAIWMYKPIGIASVGEIVVTIVDITNGLQVIKFNRARKIYAFVDINLTIDNTFNLTSIDTVKSEILNEILSLTLGEALIYQIFFGIIYKHSGILNATILLGKSDNPDATDVTKEAANITIDRREIIVSDISKIKVTATS